MKLLILIVIAYLVYRGVKSWLMRTLQVPRQGPGDNRHIDDIMVQDPVCGMHFPRREGLQLEQNGKTYYFCSTTCRDRFLKGDG